MSFESIGPLLSGIVGGLLAIVFCTMLSRWVPQVCNGKGGAELIHEYRVSIWLANGLIFAGLVAGILSYTSGTFSNTDLHGLALGVGGGSIAALLVLPLFAFLARRSPKEAYVAFAISQHSPIILLYGILVALAAGFTAAAADLIWR